MRLPAQQWLCTFHTGERYVCSAVAPNHAIGIASRAAIDAGIGFALWRDANGAIWTYPADGRKGVPVIDSVEKYNGDPCYVGFLPR